MSQETCSSRSAWNCLNCQQYSIVVFCAISFLGISDGKMASTAFFTIRPIFMLGFYWFRQRRRASGSGQAGSWYNTIDKEEQTVSLSSESFQVYAAFGSYICSLLCTCSHQSFRLCQGAERTSDSSHAESVLGCFDFPIDECYPRLFPDFNNLKP